MTEVLNVRPLPDCFNTKWGSVLGVALPSRIIEQLITKARDEAEVQKIAERAEEADRQTAAAMRDCAASRKDSSGSSKCNCHGLIHAKRILK